MSSGNDPRTIGPFTIRRVLGEGGMGKVYLGRTRSGELAAVKVVRSELAGDPEFRARFRQEVTAARRVLSAYTAALIDADPDAAAPWLATEYVPAPSLREAVARHGPMPPDSVRLLGVGLAEALTAIHRVGVVHRDLKPANVLLGADRPRVIDFGIARAADAATLTATGSVVGTPGYIAPEQLAHGRAGPASDVFSLGGVLLYAATGRPPFGEGDAAALLYRAMNVDPDLSGVPPALVPTIAACLDRNPARRPPTDRIRHTLSGSGGRDRPGAGWLPARLEPTPPTAVAKPPNRRVPVLIAGVVVLLLLVATGVTLGLLRGSGTPGPDVPTTPTATATATRPATATPDVQVSATSTGFTSPTNNIACYLGPNTVRCDIDESNWGPDTVPVRPLGCPAQWGDSVGITGNGSATFICHGDTVFGSGPVLDYGKALRVGDVTCTSRTTGVECRIGSTTRGFLISKGGYQFY